MRSIKYEKNLVKLLFDYKVDKKMETHYGSGVIVKPFESSEYLYIFTAKHTFEKEERDEDYPDDIKKFLFDDEYIKSNLRIEMSMLSCDEPSKTTELYPHYIDTISRIIQDEVVVAGFPSIREGLPCGYDSTFERYYNDNKIHVEFKSKKPLSTKDTNEYDAIKGISGGGVFIEKENQIYLVGIQIEYQVPNGFKCINLSVIYSELNAILKSRTEIIIVPIGDFFDIEMVKVDLPDKSLYVSIYPVTFEEYDLFYEEKKDILKLIKPKNTHFYNERRGTYPVIDVSWDDANKYCEWISDKVGKRCRLLSPDEWENIVQRNKILDEDIWHKNNTKEIQPIGLKKSGKLGIYDMLGNIHEWCDSRDVEKPVKGGSINYTLNEIYSDKYKSFLPEETKDMIGFRIILKKD